MRTHIFHFIDHVEAAFLLPTRNIGAGETAGIVVPRADQRAANCGVARPDNFAGLSEFRNAFVFQWSTDHEKVRLCGNGLRRKEIKINARARDHVHTRGGDVGQHSKRGKFFAVSCVLKEHRVACGK